MRTIDIGGVSVVDTKLNLLEAKYNKLPLILNFINAYSYYCFFNNPKYRKSAENAVNLPDGISILWVSYIYNRKVPFRITGTDAFMYYLQRAKTQNKKVLFIGSNRNTKSLFQKKLDNEYIGLVYKYISPTYFASEMSENENKMILDTIKGFKPNYIFVGLSAPKQEIWSYSNRNEFSEVEVILNVGAAFNFFAGTEKRAPLFLRKVGLEGVFRTLINPKKHFPKDIKSSWFIVSKIFSDIILSKNKSRKKVKTK